MIKYSIINEVIFGFATESVDNTDKRLRLHMYNVYTRTKKIVKYNLFESPIIDS